MADVIRNFNDARASVFADQEADIQAVLQELLRGHIDEVLDANPLPPPNGPEMGLESSRLLAQVADALLRQGGDVLCADLLQAALQLSQDLSDDEREPINRFLCSTAQILCNEGTDKENAFRAHLERVLLDLSQRRWYGGEQPLPPTDTIKKITSPTSDETCLTLYIGDMEYTITFGDVLSTFWDSRLVSRLETNCHACEQPIVNEPPIRTISYVSPSSERAPGIHVRVINRHFSCLKATNIPWIPVSHVWEDSIRTANQSKTQHDDATFTLLKTLETLLDASLDAYEPNTEFWHDYFSVPQWDRHVQESLLLLIPSIYHDAQEILIHMSDLSGGYIMMLLPDGRSEYSATAALRFMPALRALCSSQWMERMWVLLEYSLCRRACVMDKSDYIWKHVPGHRDTDGAPDTFTSLVRNGHSILLGLFRHAKSFASSLKDGFLAGLTDKQQEEARNLCLGEDLELIGRTKCQRFRDRFLAIHMVLHRNSPPTPHSVTIPESATEACRWVWQTALRNRDLSPLLLQPRELQEGSNPPIGMASWLTGYNDLAAAEWDLGSQRAPSRYPIEFTDDGAVKVEMDFVGKIEQIHYLDREESGEVAGVEAAIGILSSLDNSTTRRLSAAELVDGLNRIFPFDAIHTKMAQTLGNLVYTLEARQARDRRFTSKVNRCIAEWYSAPSSRSQNAQRRYVAEKITRLLKYDTPIDGGKISAELTRLTKSRHIARSRYQRGATAKGEPICAVRCPEAACRVLTAFRLDLRENAKVGDGLYRFPGLSYSETVENGVGLVIDHAGRITGRMLYGPPSCRCRTRQTVEIR